MLLVATRAYLKKSKKRLRKATSSKKRRRAKLIERDGPFCVCCKYRSENLQVHHIKKRCDGGTNDLDNLCLMCPSCHCLWHQNEKPNFKQWLKQMRKYLDTFGVPRNAYCDFILKTDNLFL